MKLVFDYLELVDLFYEAFETNQNTDNLASRIILSTGMDQQVVLKAQQEACSIFANQY